MLFGREFFKCRDQHASDPNTQAEPEQKRQLTAKKSRHAQEGGGGQAAGSSKGTQGGRAKRAHRRPSRHKSTAARARLTELGAAAGQLLHLVEVAARAHDLPRLGLLLLAAADAASAAAAAPPLEQHFRRRAPRAARGAVVVAPEGGQLGQALRDHLRRLLALHQLLERPEHPHKVVAPEREARQRGVRLDRRDARRALQERALAEEVGLEQVVDLARPRWAGLVDDGLAVEDDVEEVAGVALDDDLLCFGLAFGVAFGWYCCGGGGV